MANHHQLPSGNTAFGRLSAASSPLQTYSSTPAVDYPQSFMGEQRGATRASLRLNPRDLPDFSQDTLSGLIPSETATLTLLPQLVSGLVTISQELSGVTQKLESITEENDALKEELHDLSSQNGNLPLPQTPPPHQDLSVLLSAIRDLSHRVTAPAPPLPLHTGSNSSASAPGMPPPYKERKRKGLSTSLPPPTQTRTLNTSSCTMTQSSARLSVIRSGTHSFSRTPMKPASSGEGHMTKPLSPQVTSTPTTPPHPRMPRLPLALARAARQRRPPCHAHPNKLRAWLLPPLRRGRPATSVDKDVSLLLASPQSFTQMLQQLQQPSPTSPLPYFVNLPACFLSPSAYR